MKDQTWYYGVAMMIAALGLTLKLLAVHILGESLLEEHSPFLFFFSVVFISAWYGGFGPGILTTIICAIWSNYFFISPMYTLRLDSRANGLELAVFILEGLLVTWFTSGLQVARRRAEAAHREAQEALSVRDQFLSVAAHELKNPVTALLTSTQLLQRWTARQAILGEREQRIIRMISIQANRLHQLITTLLDLSRAQLGHLLLQRQTVDLCPLARQVVEEVQFMLDRHTLHLICTEESLMIEGDQLRLEQVLYNLLQNAIKYSPDGGPILVRIGRQGDAVCLSVQDHGIGIPAAAQPYIFERFYRAKNTGAHQLEGFGIGLSVAHEIVIQHGGKIEVESQEGKGSTFRILLPLVAQHQPSTDDGADAYAAC